MATIHTWQSIDTPWVVARNYDRDASQRWFGRVQVVIGQCARQTRVAMGGVVCVLILIIAVMYFMTKEKEINRAKTFTASVYIYRTALTTRRGQAARTSGKYIKFTRASVCRCASNTSAHVGLWRHRGPRPGQRAIAPPPQRPSRLVWAVETTIGTVLVKVWQSHDRHRQKRPPTTNACRKMNVIWRNGCHQGLKMMTKKTR